MNTPIWRTKNEGKITLTEISDSHLVNINKMVCRTMIGIADEADRIGLTALTERQELSFYGSFRWEQITRNELVRRGLEPSPLPNHPLFQAGLMWIGRGSKSFQIQSITDSSIQRLERVLQNQNQYFDALWEFSGSEFAPRPGTDAEEYLQDSLELAWLNTLALAKWIKFFRTELDRRGIPALTHRKVTPLPRVGH